VEDDVGELTAPIKLPGSSRYHVNGKLAMVSREQFRDIYNISVPLLRAGGDNAKLIVSPLPRYTTAPCCRAPGHLTNFGGKEYAKKMGRRLADLKEWLKDFTYGKKIRNFKVVCSLTAIGLDENYDAISKKELKEIVTTDPVHLAAGGYEKLATCLAVKASCGLTRPAKRKAGDDDRNQNKGPDLSTKRARWVCTDDVTVQRTQSGGYRGHRGFGPRGRGGFWKHSGPRRGRGRFNH
jgi:hypothetical protein